MPHPVLDAPISPLRQRLIDDMTLRRFGRETQRNYIRDVGRFASFLGRPPDTATADDLRRFQVEQQDDGVPVPTMNSIVSALRFFFTHTVDRPDLARKLVRLAHPRKLPVVLSRDEVARLLERHHLPQVQGRAVGRLWRRAARLRGVDAEGRRHRQRAHADPGRARQGPQGPQRDAVAAAARPAARSGGRRAAAGRDASRRLAVSGPQPGEAAHDPPAQPRCPSRQPRPPGSTSG